MQFITLKKIFITPEKIFFALILGKNSGHNFSL